MISSSYLMLIVVTLIIGMGAQWYVNHKLKTYSWPRTPGSFCSWPASS